MDHSQRFSRNVSIAAEEINRSARKIADRAGLAKYTVVPEPYRSDDDYYSLSFVARIVGKDGNGFGFGVSFDWHALIYKKPDAFDSLLAAKLEQLEMSCDKFAEESGGPNSGS